MDESRTDLLSVTRTLVRAARLFCLFMVVLLGIILVGLLIRDAGTLTVLDSSTIPPDQRIFAARVGLAGGLVGCVLFLPLLTQLLLAINIVTNVAVSVALTKGVKLPPVSFTAVVTVLMIFVIARIFDTGAAMREELRETI